MVCILGAPISIYSQQCRFNKLGFLLNPNGPKMHRNFTATSHEKEYLQQRFKKIDRLAHLTKNQSLHSHPSISGLIKKYNNIYLCYLFIFIFWKEWSPHSKEERSEACIWWISGLFSIIVPIERKRAWPVLTLLTYIHAPQQQRHAH